MWFVANIAVDTPTLVGPAYQRLLRLPSLVCFCVYLFVHHACKKMHGEWCLSNIYSCDISLSFLPSPLSLFACACRGEPGNEAVHMPMCTGTCTCSVLCL